MSPSSGKIKKEVLLLEKEIFLLEKRSFHRNELLKALRKEIQGI